MELLNDERRQASRENQERKRRESSDAFCKKHGIRIVNEQGGVEFVPYSRPFKKATKVDKQ
jgi:hypothetical protein